MGTKLDIQSIPTELLPHILDEFALQPHETGYPVLNEFRRNQAVLRKLSATTHKLGQAANTRLYETVILAEPSRLVSLVCTVSQNRKLASHVKHIAFLQTLTADVNARFQRAWDAAVPRISSLTPEALRVFRLAGLVASGTNEAAHVAGANGNKPSLCRQLDHAGERIFATLLALVPSLQSIVFQPPHAESPSSPPPAPYHTMSTILEQVQADPNLHATALQRLTTIKIQPHTQWDGPSPGTRCDGCPALLKAPNLAVFETYNEAGGWEALPHTLKDVRLFGALEPHTLSTVCAIPTLERLTVQAHPDPDEHTPAAIHDDVFNAALSQRTSTLRYLQLVTAGNESLMPGFGPLGRIHCLGAFARLEELSVEMFALVGGDSTSLDPGRCPPLEDLVPRGLARLGIWEHWPFDDPVFGVEEDALEAYRDRLLAFLLNFARSCAGGRMPALRRFRLERHSSLLRGATRGRVDSPVVRLKDAFADAGVTMEVGIF